MKKLFVLLLLLAVSGCQQKTVEDRIIESAQMIETNSLNEKMDNHGLFSRQYPKVVYVKSINLFNVHIHYYNVYNDAGVPAHPKIVIAAKLPDNKIVLLKHTPDIIQYIRPFYRYELRSYGRDYFTAKSDNFLAQILEFNELMNIDSIGIRIPEVIINSFEDIPKLSDNDRERLTQIGFYPLRKSLFTDRLEVTYYTWNYKKTVLSENKLNINEKLQWQRKIVLSDFGPKNPQPFHR